MLKLWEIHNFTFTNVFEIHEVNISSYIWMKNKYTITYSEYLSECR